MPFIKFSPEIFILILLVDFTGITAGLTRLILGRICGEICTEGSLTTFSTDFDVFLVACSFIGCDAIISTC